MDYFELIASRESCRAFDGNRPVEHEKLVKMMDAARIAPSACNSQPWRFTVVETQETAHKLAACCQDAGMNRFASDCPAFVVVREDAPNLTARIGGKIKGQSFAPIDIGLSVMQMCLAARAQGLSTCILGWLNEKRINELLGFDGALRVRLVVCVGYAAKTELRVKQRKPVDDIVNYV